MGSYLSIYIFQHVQTYNAFIYYPCNSIWALNIGCIDAPIPISYADTP